MTKRNLSDLLRQEATKDESTAPVSSSTTGDEAKAATTRTRKSATTPAADLEHQVQELKAALAQAAEQEQEMQDQIKNLQSELKHKDQQMIALKVDVASVDKLQRELAEAKDVILQLSEANTQMSQTLDQLKTPPQSSKAIQRKESIPQKEPIPRKPALSSITPIRHHSVQHGPSSIKPSKLDVGWMD